MDKFETPSCPSSLSIEELASIPGFKSAAIGSDQVLPKIFMSLYHGNSEISPNDVTTSQGIPAKGDDIDLIRHAEPPSPRDRESAFRGSVLFPQQPSDYAVTTAVDWAGEDGWVYHLKSWRGYDLNEVLEGKIPDGKGGYRGLLMQEQEIAIVARVPLSFIVKHGKVVKNSRGQLKVNWVGNEKETEK